MNMTIEVLQRGEHSFLAVAYPQGALLSDAGVGGGDSEREAIVQAVNSYFKRREQAEAASTSFIEQERDICGGFRSKKVVRALPDIRNLLQEAAGNGDDVFISGKKTTGNRYNNRRVTPYRVWEGPTGTEYLSCEDANSGEDRSFRLDGIERVEVA